MSDRESRPNSPRIADIGRIIEDIHERQARGERPRLADYEPLSTEARGEIANAFQVLEILDELRPQSHPEAIQYGKPGESLDKAIAALPPSLRRVIYLRHFEKLSWERIAAETGEPAQELRRAYARTVQELMERCGGTREAGLPGHRPGG